MKTANKIKIGVDIDEVLMQCVSSLNDFYNVAFGTSFRFEDYKHYDLEEVWGGTKERAVEIVDSFFHSDSFLRMLPVEDAVGSIEFLAREGYPLISITSRPSFLRNKTSLQIKKYFGKNISEIWHNGNYNMHSSKLSKTELALSRGIDFFVEDNLDVAVGLANVGIPTYLLERPWNREENSEKGVMRVKNWTQILESLKTK